MKFTPKEDIKHGQMLFEEGSTYSTEKQPITDDEVRTYHRLGVVDLEGEETPPRVTTGGTLDPQKSRVGSTSKET